MPMGDASATGLSRRHFLAGMGAAALAPWGRLAAAAGADRPNILLITGDDLGLQLSCYGEKRIQTPRLDAFAREGVRFENAYVAQPSCSASRGAMLTGLWPHQNGLVGLSHLGFRMHPGQQTLPALLKAAGYRNGIIGKLHVEPAADAPFDWMPAKVRMAAPPTRDVKWVAEQTREFLATVKQSGQPFFHYVNYFDPHGPLNETTDQVNGLPEKPLGPDDIQEPLPSNAPTELAKRRFTARMLNTILRIDAGMGLLLEELRAAGCADNTIVVFVGDNGIPGPRGKASCYELGVRVPMLVRWPGTARSGVVRPEPVSLVDLMPTLLAAAGAEAPGNLVGQPLQPLLRGEQGRWREFLFTEMNFHEPQQFRGQRTLRDGRHKLVLNLAPQGDTPPVQLYDLQADPWETKDLAADPALAATRRRLETALAELRRQTADPLLDQARVARWRDAAERWNKLPRVQAGPSKVVRIPEGELDLLR